MRNNKSVKINEDELSKVKERLWAIAKGERDDINPMQLDMEIKSLKTISDIVINEKKLNIAKTEAPKDIKVVLLSQEQRDKQANRLKNMENEIKDMIDENGELRDKNKDVLF